MRLPLRQAAGSAAGLALVYAWVRQPAVDVDLLLGAGAPIGVPILFGLLALAALGFALLAWLPPGRLGARQPRELARTWAASHIIGVTAIECAARVMSPTGGVFLPVLAGIGATLALARWFTRPAAMVPRYPAPAESLDTTARVVRVALVVCAAFGLIVALRRPLHTLPSASTATAEWLTGFAPGANAALAERVLGAAGWIALIVLVENALRLARRAPAGRASAALLVALTPLPLLVAFNGGASSQVAVLFGAGCAGLLPWLRRADRQSLACALVAFVGCAVAGKPALAFGGLVALLAVTPRPALGFAVRALIVVAVVVGPLLIIGGTAASGPETELVHVVPADLIRAAADPALFGMAWILFVVAIPITALRRPTREAAAPSIDANGMAAVQRPVREIAGLGIAIALAGTAELMGGATATNGLTLIFPAAALFTALVIVRSERPVQPPRS